MSLTFLLLPLATVVILGGLVTSTLLNLFLLPALYARFGGRKTA
jgi:cobalt-zinc-cadmium resistance protein CzcA